MRKINKVTIILFCLSFLLEVKKCHSQQPKEKAYVVLAPIFQQYENIYCEFSDLTNPYGVAQGKYWKKGRSERSSGEFVPNNYITTIRQDDVFYNYMVKTKNIYIKRWGKNTGLSKGDILEYVGLKLRNNNDSVEFLDVFFNSNDYPVEFTSEPEGDYSLSINNKYGKQIFLLSKKYNYHPILVRRFDLNGNPSSELRISNFTEVEPGWFFPSISKTNFFFAEEMKKKLGNNSEIVYEIKKISTKENIPDSIFNLKPPPGSKVFDEINQAYSIVQSDGTKKKTKYEVVTSSNLNFNRMDSEHQVTQSEINPSSGYWVSGFFSLCLLVFGSCIFLWRKIRSFKNASI